MTLVTRAFRAHPATNPSGLHWLTLALWLVAAAPVSAAETVSGVVRDASGAVVVGAEVVLMTPERASVARGRTDAQGRFRLTVPGAGRFVLVVRAPHLGETTVAVGVGGADSVPLEVVLDVGRLRDEVTVTASRSVADDIRRAGQPVSLVDSSEIEARVRTVVAQAVEGEAGVQLQRTSPTMAGVFVRGLTGNKVNVFVDGVRYSNGAQRGGVNTFLDLIEPDSLEAIEIVRGPSSAQYGSDALGGSVQFLSRPPELSGPGTRAWGGTFGAAGGTAHLFGSGQAFVSFRSPSVGVTGSITGRAAGRLRPGGGIDSHAAVTRFLGVPSNVLMDARLPDTGFRQYGGAVRTQLAPSTATRLVLGYTRTRQDGGKRYDQLLGGDGNLVADLNGLALDLFSARLERLGAGLFDHVTVAYSLNSQREERVNQGGNGDPAAVIGHEPERTTVHGLQASLTKQLNARHTVTAGGDVYVERLSSDSFNVNPVTGGITVRRPRVPDGARYTQGGAFAQSTFDLRPDRIRLIGALRIGGASYTSRASDSPLVNGSPLWPDDDLATASVTFRGGVVLTPSDRWTLTSSISRGFRAPHMTDLGTLGLTGAGFEVAAPDVAGLGASVGSTSNAQAVSTGAAVAQLRPETSVQYEGTLAYRRRTWRSELSLFVNQISDNIQKQALILPPGAVGLSLGGQPVVAQNPNGTVFVALTSAPVLVRANFDNARIWGIEHALQANLGPTLSLRTAVTYTRALDTATHRPPNIEGGTPAPDAFLTARWTPGGGWWLEPYAHLAARQSRLSSLDLEDRRTASPRSRASIAAFFANGARARGWTGPGADGRFGTADDVLLATGETLTAIQDRVLGQGVASSVLYPYLPGFATAGVRAGFRTGHHEVIVDAENLTDGNYRGISWGVDGPGRGISMKYLWRF